MCNLRGMFFRGRDVAVVGGGNTALEDAMFLSNYCKKVYIIHRRDKLRGEEKIAKAISEKDNIEMVWNSNVVKLIGDDKVEGITVKNSVDGSEKDIQVSGLFIAVGQEPDNYDFEELYAENKDNILGMYIKKFLDRESLTPLHVKPFTMEQRH